MSELEELYVEYDQMSATLERVRPELVALRHTLDRTPEWEQEPLRQRERQLVGEMYACRRYEAIGYKIRELVNDSNKIAYELAGVIQEEKELQRSSSALAPEKLREAAARRVYLQTKLDRLGTPRRAEVTV